MRERLRGIGIDLHLGRLFAGFPEYSSAKEVAATMYSKSSSWERHFRYSSNQFWEKFNFSALPMKSEMCSIVVVSPLVSVMRDQVEQLKQLGVSAAAIGLGEEYGEDEKAARGGKCELVFGN